MVDERWFTVENIAEALQVHPNTVRRWLRNGQLAGHNFGGKTGYRVRDTDFERFLDARFERPEVSERLRTSGSRVSSSNRVADWVELPDGNTIDLARIFLHRWQDPSTLYVMGYFRDIKSVASRIIEGEAARTLIAEIDRRVREQTGIPLLDQPSEARRFRVRWMTGPRSSRPLHEDVFARATLLEAFGEVALRTRSIQLGGFGDRIEIEPLADDDANDVK